MRVEGRPLGRAGLPPLPPPRAPPPRPPGSLEPRRALLCEGREGKWPNTMVLSANRAS